jgi:bifunctional non-homologous end joining protein LigD
MIAPRPMLCGQSFAELPPNLEGWLAHAKWDGWRAIAHRQEDRVQVWGGRNASEYSGQVGYIEEGLLEALPLDTIVDGELISPLGHGGVGSAMSTKVAHEPNSASPALTYMIFDVLRVDGVDVRRLLLEERLRLVERIAADSCIRTASVLEPVGDSLQMALTAGLEGVVLKRLGSSYLPTRSPLWAKVKPMQSMDCRIVNLPHDGEGSFAGLVGAVEFELPDGQIGRASGMSMAVRQEMTGHPERYEGKIAEISYQLISKDGRPRHPIYKRLRPELEINGASTERAGSQERRKRNPALGRSVDAPPKERKKLVAPSASTKAWTRNYAQMGRNKLEQCLAELEMHEGDAYERCIARGGNLDDHIQAARTALENKS